MVLYRREGWGYIPGWSVTMPAHMCGQYSCFRTGGLLAAIAAVACAGDLSLAALLLGYTNWPSRNVAVRSILDASSGLWVAISAATP